MAQPSHRRLRPPRQGGLTRPDRSAPDGRTATRTPPPSPGTRTSRTTGERQDAHARIHLAKLLVRESDRKRPAVIDRWIEAKEARNEERIWI